MAVVVERYIAATMRDGAVLKADVYRPAIGRHPVLVLRTPYGKGQVATISGTLDPVRAAEAGYVVVVQDVRGRFASDGPAFFPYRDEPADSFDTIEWAAGLDVSNGRVGAFGVSYMGATAWQAAVGQPPHLGAIAAADAPSDFYETIVRGGAVELGHARRLDDGGHWHRAPRAPMQGAPTFRRSSWPSSMTSIRSSRRSTTNRL